MQHIEDHITDSNSTLNRRLVAGLRDATQRIQERNEGRFLIVLRGPTFNGDQDASLEILRLQSTPSGSGQLKPAAIRAAWIEEQRRKFPDPRTGIPSVDFLSADGTQVLSSGWTYGDLRWGPLTAGANNEGEDQDEDRDEDEDPEGDDEPIPHFGRRDDLAAFRREFGEPTDRSPISTIGLAHEQRGIVKDIERDDMMRQLFNVTLGTLRTQQEDARQTNDLLRSLALRSVASGGGRPQQVEANASGDGFAMVMRAWEMFAKERARTLGKNGGKGRGQRRPAVPGTPARPALPPDPFTPPSFSSPPAAPQPNAVDRVLGAGSPSELGENTFLPAVLPQHRPPARRQDVDVQSVLDGLGDVEMIQRIYPRIGELAGENREIVEGFLDGILENHGVAPPEHDEDDEPGDEEDDEPGDEEDGEDEDGLP